MNLKNRIIISFFVAVLVPIVLTGAALMVFVNYELRSMKQQYEMNVVSYESLSDNRNWLHQMTRTIYNEVEKVSKNTPEKMESVDFFEKINHELGKNDGFLVVRKENQIIYPKDCEENRIQQNELPVYGDRLANTGIGTYIGVSSQLYIKQIDFHFPDKKEGSAFLIVPANLLVPQLRSLLGEMMVAVILVLCITALGLCMWIYGGVITPLNQLKQATQNIKDGNLDFTVEKTGVAEIGDLCEDFEEMRQRLKQSAEERVTYDQESRELISNISHDLKTPITAVKGYVEGIMDGVADTPEKMEKYIRTIYTKANEMDRLINELTFYSKIDTNRIPYTFNKINISDYFEDCVEELGVELESGGVSLEYHNYLEEEAVIIADAEQLKRVINNIISNAMKYMDKPSKKIELRLKDVGDFIQLEIEDNGKGIAQRDLANIFDRFYRTDTSRNSSKGGSGIGLSIVMKIMEDHGGQVWATSKEGVGTTLYLAFRKYQEVPVHE